ncbi:MAG: NosD domain-containing protein [Thermodesulfobacteriota bacterium]
MKSRGNKSSLVPLFIIGPALILILTASASPVQAATRWCKPGTAAGGTGTKGDPWVTLNYALGQLSSGDTLMVTTGTYSGSAEDYQHVIVSKNNVIINAEPNVILDGAGLTGWVNAIDVMSSSYVTIQGLTIKNFTKGVYINNSSYVDILSNFFDNCGTGVHGYLGFSNVNVINNIFISNTGQYGVEAAYHNPMTILHNTFKGGEKGVYISDGSCMPTVNYNIIVNYLQYGIYHPSTGPNMYYNNVWRSTLDNYYAGCSGVNDFHIDPGLDASGRPSNDAAWVNLIPLDQPDTVEKDHLGYLRPQGTGFDIGAYEKNVVLTHTRNFPPGSTAEAYVMSALPFEPEDSNPTTALGPQIGTYDPTKMRIGHWEASSQSYMEYPFSGSGPMHPGGSAWMLFRNGQNLTMSGYFTRRFPIGPGSERYNGIKLEQYWNQVGNPFMASIDVGQIKIRDTNGNLESLTAATLTQGVIWLYNSGAYSAYNSGSVGVGVGFWVKMLAAWGGELLIQAPLGGDLAPADHQTQAIDSSPAAVPDSLERPPAPPQVDAAGGSFSSGGGGGGGAGGCFLAASAAD